MIKGCLVAAGIAMMTVTAKAQLSTNPDKFLGNITTGWNSDMDTDGFIFADYWNQVTPENATKWGSVEGDRQGKFNWEVPTRRTSMPRSTASPSSSTPSCGDRSIPTG